MEKKPGEIRIPQIALPIAVFIFLGAILFSIICITCPIYQTELIIIGYSIWGAAVLYTAYYIGKTMQLNYKMDKIKTSFNFLQLFMDYNITELRIFIDNRIKDIKPLDLYDEIVKDIDLSKKIGTILNYFEILSVSIQLNYSDEYILKKSLNYIAIWIFDSLNPYIQALREKRKIKTFYVEFEKLVNAWKHEKSLFTGKDLKL